MIANAAFLAAITTFLVIAFLAGELAFLAPYKAGLVRQHGLLLATGTGLLFANLCAVYYNLARWLFLRETGRKLFHLDRQLHSPDAVLTDLRRDLNA